MSLPRRKTKRKSQRTYCDTLFSLAIRERDRVCQASGLWGIYCNGRLEAAHFIGRGKAYSVRWDPDNAAALCSAHHFFLDSHEPLKWEWVSARLGPERYAELRRKADARWDRDYLAVRERIRELSK